MSEASFASLGPTLLARKGGAKPAMRPQVAPLPDMVEDDEKLEDLGWNDMGHESGGTEKETTAEVVSINTAEQRKHVVAKAATKSKPAHGTAKKPSTTTGKAARRAAFTLRLDPERHLKLRLAATMQEVSAQALVTEALDALLNQIEDLDTLASRMKRN